MSEPLATLLAEVAKRADGESARRLFHGRGHCFPGLEQVTVDRFGSVVHVSTYRGATLEPDTLVAPLRELLPWVTGISAARRDGRRTESRVLWGEVPPRIEAREAGLGYWVELLASQNVGFFLDMQPTRAWLRDQCRDQRVLNLFAYTCAFSVVAVAGGAQQVVNVDMSKSALAWGRRNHELNGHDARRVLMVPMDVRKCWSRVAKGAPYDVVIVDPPTNQPGSFNTQAEFSKVLRQLPRVCHRGTRIVCCVNSPYLNQDFITQQVMRWCPACVPLLTMPPSADFPERNPDAGLKVEIYRYDGPGG